MAIDRIKLLWLGIGLLIAVLAAACGEATTTGPSDDVADSTRAPTPATMPTTLMALSADLTPKEFFAVVERAITRQGFLFHTFTETVAGSLEDADSIQRLWTVETWLDVAQGRGRSHFQKDSSATELDLPDRFTRIVFEDTMVEFYPLPEELKKGLEEGRLCGKSADYLTLCEGQEREEGPFDEVPYIEVEEGKARVCPFMDSPLLSMLMFACENLSAPPGGKVEVDLEYDGQPAAAVTYLEEGENPVTFYVHRESLLPLAWVIEYGEPGRRSAWVTSYKNDFVPLDSLPPDFLDPASIGYVKRDPLAPLDNPDLGVTVYWLGRAFDPPGDLPPLVLDERSIGVAPPGEGHGPGNRASMSYRIDEGGPGVHLSLWQPEKWDEFLQTQLGRLWWDSQCVEAKEVSLKGGEAIIFMGHEPEYPESAPPSPPPAVPVRPGDTPLVATVRPPPTPLPKPVGECATGHFDYYLAHAYLGDTVVAVNMPLCFACVGRGFEPDPYDSLEGMEAVVKGLQPRAPGE